MSETTGGTYLVHSNAQQNVSLGYSALPTGTNGSTGNVAIGNNSLQTVTALSNYNTAVGYYSGQAITATGTSNVCVGYGSGRLLSLGTGNTLIGATGACWTGASNCIVLRFQAVATGSNQLVFGNAALETAIVATGQADSVSATRISVKIGTRTYVLLAI